MNRSMYSVLMASIVVGLSAAPMWAGDTKVEKEILDERASDINAKAKKPGLREVALRSVSVETGVPRDEVEAMYKRHDSIAGVLIASVLADETKKPPEYFWEKRTAGKKSWTTLARDYRVPLEKINDRLGHLERDLARAGEPERDRRK